MPLKRPLFALLLLFVPFCLSAQVTLLPSIGISSLPADSTPLCAIPTFTGNYDTTGISEGDTLSDFTLYDLSGGPVHLGTELAAGKPILMVAGSYTCPVFRNKIDEINQVISTYGNDLKVLVIYTVEAHPDQDISPYFGVVNTGNTNLQAGILYRQPTTYGERKIIAQDLLDSLPLNCPLLIDGPCDEWWSHYGPAPNNAYLVDTNGVVFAKHGWFDKYPDDIFCDIDSLLGNPTNCGVVANGDFEFYLTSANGVTGQVNTTLSATANLVNTGSRDVVIGMKKLMVDLPADWSASICTDVCYPSTVDSASFYLAAGDTQKYTMYFYTGATPDTGRIRMGFRNENNPQNSYMQIFWGVTDSSLVGVPESLPVNIEPVKIFPHPFQEEVTIRIPTAWVNTYAEVEVAIFDAQGRRVRERSFMGQSEMILSDFGEVAGIYSYLIIGDQRILKSGKLVRYSTDFSR